jgi:hypothetical protein
VLNLTGNGALDVFIGLAFFFFLLSIVCSAVNEAIATLMNYRAKDLEKGIAGLLAHKANVDAFYSDPRVRALFKPTRGWEMVPGLGRVLSWAFGSKLPSYIPARVFAQTVVDMFTRPAGAQAPVSDATGNLLERARAVLTPAAATPSSSMGTSTARPESSAPVVNDFIRRLLQDAIDEANDVAGKADEKVAVFRSSLERSFNEAMDRVSGWYKRRVQLILFVVALVVAGGANADSYAVGKTLWQNDAIRSTVVQQAVKTANGGSNPECGKEGSPVQKAANCIAGVKQLGLPLGWSGDTSPDNWKSGLGKVGGLLLTAFAVLLGAPFWFDALGKLAQLKGAGNVPGTGPHNAP